MDEKKSLYKNLHKTQVQVDKIPQPDTVNLTEKKMENSLEHIVFTSLSLYEGCVNEHRYPERTKEDVGSYGCFRATQCGCCNDFESLYTFLITELCL